MTRLVPLETIDPLAIEHLLDRAFGTDRHHRTAYRLRVGTNAIAALSFAAVDGGTLIGSIQCWPIELRQDSGTVQPLVLVGPVAVLPERQRDGIGRTLMQATLAAADVNGLGDAMMLIGDPEYYGRFFGFTADDTGGWRLPGPVDRHRLLARGSATPRGIGMIAPRVAVTA